MTATPTLHLTDAQIDEAAARRARQDSRRAPRDPRNALVARGSWGNGQDEPDDEAEKGGRS